MIGYFFVNLLASKLVVNLVTYGNFVFGGGSLMLPMYFVNDCV